MRYALQGTPRLWLVSLHRWSGFLIMIFLTLAALSGIWLVFREPLHHALRSPLEVVTPGQVRLPDDEIVARVEAAYPAAMVFILQMPLRPDDSMWVDVRPREPGVELPYDRVYINPYTGELLGERMTHHISFDSIDSFIHGLHIQLVGGPWGFRTMGVVAAIWLLSSLVGLALSWPPLWRRLRSWAGVLSLRPGNAYRLNQDVHRAGGVWLLPVSVMLAFTAVVMNLPELVRPVVASLSPLAQRPAGTAVAEQDARVSFGEADAAVGQRFPEAKINNILRDYFNGRYSVYFHLPDDINPRGSNFALVDLRSREITGVIRPAQGSAGDRFMAWIFPLHSGQAFGWPGRLLVALSGAVIVVTNGASLYTWIARRRRRGIA
ncbi:MAG: PepSY-associated TM helix domain-containing protein [Steroidobacteraceae bacterium]